MTWRDIHRPRIRAIIENVGTDDKKALKQALFDGWDYGARENHPYKIWLDEIRRQLGLKIQKKKSRTANVVKGQGNLF
jgi:hypothetical protein